MKLKLFGAGHMGAALARGMLRRGLKGLEIVDPDERKLKEFRELGVEATTTCHDVGAGDMLMLAMPPQAFPAFAQSAAHLHGHRGTVISVMAGVTTEVISASLRADKIIRGIPNTPSEVFEGMTLYTCTPAVSEQDESDAVSVLESIGKVAKVKDESLIDPATALCGGGPAFVAFFADALETFGHQAGLPADVARRVTEQLLRGTAELMASSGKPALQLCREVMTPGGTTERGIWMFEEAGLKRTVTESLARSAARSRELGRLAAADFAAAAPAAKGGQ